MPPNAHRSKQKAPNTRAIAAHALSPVLIGRRSLSLTLDHALKSVPPEEKGLLQELCMGCLRMYPRIALMLKKLLAKPLKSKDSDISALLAIGIYQLSYMRTPDHAAINQTVEAAKALNKAWAVKLVNGVLREFIRERQTLEQALNGSLVFSQAHPQWFIDQLRKDWPDSWQAILAANNQKPPITLRVNTKKQSVEAYKAKLDAFLHSLDNDASATQCTYSQSGLSLKGFADITQLPGFNEGEFSVQDEAAQLAAELLDLKDNHTVLDACSAPGGKATHICETANNIALTCIDSESSRMSRVEENLARLGHKAKLIVSDANDTKTWWDGTPFDRILLDAPCSATGVIRRHPDIKLLRRPSDIEALATLQKQILDNIWPTLAAGGTLVYATCSVLKQENEHIIKQFLNKTANATHQPIDSVQAGIRRPFGKQLFPVTDGHDGFYYAKISKSL